MNSFACAQNIRNSCPDTEFSDIEVILEDVLSVAELCQRIRSPHHFLEGKFQCVSFSLPKYCQLAKDCSGALLLLQDRLV